MILLDLLRAPDNVAINNNCQIHFGSSEVSLRFEWKVQYQQLSKILGEIPVTGLC